MDEIICAEDVMKRLNVSRSTLWVYQIKGLPHYRLNAHIIYFKWAEVEKWWDDYKKEKKKGKTKKSLKT